MNKHLQKILNTVKKYGRKQVWKRIRMATAAIVVFCVVYGLILPALSLDQSAASVMPGIAAADGAGSRDSASGTNGTNTKQSRELDCGIEEHIHTDACYKVIAELDAKGNDTGRTEKVLICGKADYVVHIHDDNCYQDGELVCKLPEIAEHKHTEDCYEMQSILACGLVESEEHQHTKDCYEEQRVLVCDKLELHTHTMDCYACGPKNESPEEMGWAHYEITEDGAQVLAGDPNHLICGKTELLQHEHDDACFRMAEVTDDEAEAIDKGIEAEAVDEETEAASVDEETEAAAVDEGIEAEVVDEESLEFDAADGEDADAAEADTERDAETSGAAAGETVREVDAEIIEDADAESANREDADAGTSEGADAEEANAEDADAKTIKNTDADAETEPAEDAGKAEEPEEGTVTREIPVDGADYNLIVTYTEESGIPANAAFRAVAVQDSHEDYDAYREKAFASVDEIANEVNSHAEKMLGLFDLTIYGEDGNAIEPAAPVSVTVDFGGVVREKKEDGIFAVHFPENTIQEASIPVESAGDAATDDAEDNWRMSGNAAQAEEVQTGSGKAADEEAANRGKNVAKTILKKLTDSSIFSEQAAIANADVEVIKAAEQETGEVSFEAGGFSVYAIVYTVDFHWEVDGKEFAYHMKGGSSICFKELLPALNIVCDDPVTEINEVEVFYDKIQDVTFSDDTLLAAAHPEKDLTLKDLKAELGVTSDVSEAYATVAVPQDEMQDEMNERSELQYSFDTKKSDGLSFYAPGAWNVEGDETAEQETTGAVTELAEIAENELISAGTWVLISLKPFLSEESLTVTMENGDAFVIKVTDAQGDNWDVWFDGTLGQGGRSNRFYSNATDVHRTVSKNDNKITLPGVGGQITAPSSANYQYDLRGWVDIRTGTWYAPGTEVQITQDTVFYADWVPYTFDIDDTVSGNGKRIDVPSTAGFIQTELFDYNELINTHNGENKAAVSVSNSGGSVSHADTWTSKHDFNFISWNFNGNPSNSIGMMGGLQVQSQYRYDTLTKGIYEGSNGFIKKLFSNKAEDDLIGKTNVTNGVNADGLFNYNPTTGEYYYDSDRNAATYNHKDNQFYVYEEKEYIYDNDGSTKMTNFLPFNDYVNQITQKQNTGATNYWFGMKNTINFYLPYAVSSTQAKDGNKIKVGAQRNDMVFKFSGDDDVWVFVEDEAGNMYKVLDLGGIHNRAGGIIDFANGTVKTFKGTIDKRLNEVVDSDATAELKKVPSGNLKLHVYYLERGSSLSNCAIYFNLLPKPKTLELSKRLDGLTKEDREKYSNEVFTYHLIVNGESYNTPADDDGYLATYYKQDGTTERIKIKDGHIELKDGEKVVIPRLNYFDTFYIAEEKGLNMDQFETPHAERKYLDTQNREHEEDVDLFEERTQDGSAVADWKTQNYKLEETEEITFTNTLRETEIEVKKTWIDEEGIHPDITFRVQATADGKPYEVEGLKESYTLSTDNGEKNGSVLINKLPVMSTATEPITYTVSEAAVAGYTTTYKKVEDLWDIDVMKLWADNAHTDETIKVILQRLSDGKYYKGAENGKATFTDDEKQADVKTLEKEADNSGNYRARFSDVPRGDTYKAIELDDENKLTEGLVTFKRDVIRYEITNTKDDGKITVVKEWRNAQGKKLPTAPEQPVNYTIYQEYHVHKWSAWENDPDNPPKESKSGYVIRHCIYDDCEARERQEAEATGHRWVVDHIVQPTCEEQGYTVYRCTNEDCSVKDRQYTDNYVPALGHNMQPVTDQDEASNNGAVAATCTEPGVAVYKCANGCGKYETKAIPALGHDFGEWEADANGTTETRTCKRDPGHTQTRTITPYNKAVPFNESLLYANAKDVFPAVPKTDTDWNNGNGKVVFPKTGVVLLDGKYYIIIPLDNQDSFTENWNQVYDWNAKKWKTDFLQNRGLVEISDKSTVYDDYKWAQGNIQNFDNNKGWERTDLKKGDLYHTSSDEWYVYTDNSNNGYPPPANTWKKLPNTKSQVTDHSNDGNAANGAPSQANALRKRTSLKAAAGLRAEDDGVGEKSTDGNEDQSGDDILNDTADSKSIVIPTNLSALAARFTQRDEDGHLTDGKGNYLIVYSSGTLGSTEHNAWNEEIEVPKDKTKDQDPNWIKPKYYVTETSPTEYETSYVYENKNPAEEGYIPAAEGINEGGRMTIINKEVAKTKDFKFHKIWHDSSQQETSWVKDIPVTLYSKTAGSDTGTKVAEFILGASGGSLKEDPEESSATYTWLTERTNDGKKTTFTLSNLPAQDDSGHDLIYYVAEGQVDGYKTSYLLKSGAAKSDGEYAGEDETIVNSPVDAYELPSTGGSGTRHFVTTGMILILGAGLLLIMKRRTQLNM